MSRLKEFRYFIYAATLLGQQLYWGMYSLLGGEITSDTSGGAIYKAFLIGLFVLTFVFSLKDINFNRIKGNSKFVFFIILLYIFFYLFENFIGNGGKYEWTQKSFIFFGLYAVPGVLIGTAFYLNGYHGLYKHLDLISFVFGIGYLRSLPRMLFAGSIIEGYNNLAYYSAISFGFILYGILSKRKDRYAIFNFKITKIFSIIVALLLIVCVLSSGGRGGTMLLFVEIIILVTSFIKKKNIISTIVISVPVIIMVVFLFSNLFSNSIFSDILEKGTGRAFSYFGKGGIDMSQTSNRDIKYREAWKLIQENPLLGSGVFSTIGKYGYPHNIFLEIWESGGFFFLFIWLIIMMRCYFNYRKILKMYKSSKALLPLFLYPLVELLFSGSYVMEITFFFAIATLLPKPLMYQLQYKEIPQS